jgi:hypothetical protein
VASARHGRCALDRRSLWFLIALSLLCRAATASAHPNHGPSWGERYLKLEATADGVRVVYGLTVSARFGHQLRTATDSDRNGDVDEAEVATFGRNFAERLSKNVVLEVDDLAREEIWATPFTAGLGGPSAQGPIAVETSTTIEVPPGLHKVTIDDRAEFDGIYRTTAKIMAAPGVEIARAGKGRVPGAQELRLVFLDLPEDGPAPPRVITLELSVPGSTWPKVRWWSFGLGAGGSVLVATIAVVLWRRRRRLTEPGRDTGR